MGKSFVLKDASGRPGGYVMQSFGQICCRADGIRGPAQLALLDGDAICAQLALTEGEESRWPDPGYALKGAVVHAERSVLLCSDGETQRAFERLACRPQQNASPHAERNGAREERRRDGMTESVSAEGKNTEESGHTEKSAAEALPQRRWPPPPCSPAARYTCGRWQEQT